MPRGLDPRAGAKEFCASRGTPPAPPFLIRPDRYAIALRQLRSLLRRRSLRASARWLLSPFLPPAKTPDGLAARRKPRSSERNVGSFVPRSAARQTAASLPQLPPRLTRFEPSLAPSGSTAAVSPKSANQSCVHSNRFPCRTNKPRMLGHIPAADGRACRCSPRTSQIAPAGSRRCYKAVSRPRSGTAGRFPLRLRRQVKSPSTQLQRPVPRGPARLLGFGSRGYFALSRVSGAAYDCSPSGKPDCWPSLRPKPTRGRTSLHRTRHPRVSHQIAA